MQEGLNNLNLVNMFCLVWKDQNATYFPNGASRAINCNHEKQGYYQVTIKGEVTPLQNTTFIPGTTPPASPPASDWQQQQAYVTEGQTYGRNFPFPVTNTGVKTCIKIKDLSTNITYYCDAADYAAHVVQCNPAPYISVPQ